MQACWATEPWTRPSFGDVVDALRRVPGATQPTPNQRQHTPTFAARPVEAQGQREWQFMSAGPMTFINAGYIVRVPDSEISDLPSDAPPLCIYEDDTSL